MLADQTCSGCQVFDQETLPKDWDCEPLGQWIALEYGVGLIESQRTQGDVPVFGANGVSGTHGRAFVEGPGILVGRKGATGAGLVHFSLTAFWPIDTVYYVRRLRDYPWRYLYYLLLYLNLSRLSITTGIPGLSRQDAYAIRGAFPPKREAEDISRVLDAADTAIERSREAIAKARRVRRGIVQGFFEAGVGRVSSADRPGKHLAKGWRLEPTGKLLARNPKNGISPRAEVEPPGFITFSIGAVRDGKIDLMNREHWKYARINPRVAQEFLLRPGDLLIVRGNANSDLVGRCGMVEDLPTDCIYPDILKRIIFEEREGGVLPRFAALAWNHSLIHNQVLKRAKTSNGTLKINSRDVCQIVLPVPPRHAQERLIEAVAAADRQLGALEKSLSALERVKRGLMQDLFTGRVRVNSKVPAADLTSANL